MRCWYRKTSVGIGLRIAGLLLLALAWRDGAALLHRHPDSSIGAEEFLLTGLMVLGGSFGSALAVMGGGLWEPMEVPDRWRRL